MVWWIVLVVAIAAGVAVVATTVPSTTTIESTATASTDPTSTGSALTSTALPTTPSSSTPVSDDRAGALSLASWSEVQTESNRQPSVVVDESVYPNVEGVQFLLNGEVDDRCSCRPGGFDATGPQEGSKFHVYPDVALVDGDVIEARWVDRSGVARSSRYVVGGAGTGPVPSDPPPSDPPPSDPPPSDPPPSDPPPSDPPPSDPPPSDGRPDEGSTGHDGNLTRSFGSSTITQGWLNANNGGSRVLEDVRFTGQVTVEVDDLTIRNFEIIGGSTYGVYNGVFSGDPTSGLVLEDGEISGQDSAGLVVSNTVARRLHVHHQQGDAFKPFRNVTIEDCYVHHLGSKPDVHADGVQMVSGSSLIVRGCHFDMPKGVPGYKNSQVLIIQTQNGTVDDVLIDGNWINGGSYSVHVNDKGVGYGYPQNVRIVNNRFGRDYLYGLFHFKNGRPDVLTGNVWDDTGNPVN